MPHTMPHTPAQRRLARMAVLAAVLWSKRVDAVEMLQQVRARAPQYESLLTELLAFDVTIVGSTPRDTDDLLAALADVAAFDRAQDPLAQLLDELTPGELLDVVCPPAEARNTDSRARRPHVALVAATSVVHPGRDPFRHVRPVRGTRL